MGSLTLQYPPMTGGSAEQQLDAMRRYLMQMTDELNGADWSAQAVFQQVAQAIDAEQMPEGEERRSQLAGWASLKELIIKTADYTMKNSEGFSFQLSGNYLALSDFGEFQEQMRLALEANETGIQQTYTYVGTVKTEILTDVDGKLTTLGTDVDGKLSEQALTLEEYKTSISGELNTFTDEWGTKYSGLDEAVGKLGTRTGTLEDETAGINNERGEGQGKDESGTTITVQSKQYVKTGLLYYDLLEPVYGVGVGNIKTKIDVLSDGKEVTIVDKENLLLTISPENISFWEAGKQIAYLEAQKMHFPSATLEAYDATLTGTITAAAGSSFGPWKVTASSIYRAEDETENKLGGDGLYFGTGGLSIKDAFQVDADGKLTATGATVTGTIRANDLLLRGTNADGETVYSSIQTSLKTLVDSVNELSVLAEAVSVSGAGESASASGFDFFIDGIGGLQVTSANSGSYAVELSSEAALRLKSGTGTLYIQNSGNTGAMSVLADGTVSMKGTKFRWNGSDVTFGTSTATAVFG